jgi:hypothetical protein
MNMAAVLTGMAADNDENNGDVEFGGNEEYATTSVHKIPATAPGQRACARSLTAPAAVGHCAVVTVKKKSGKHCNIFATKCHAALLQATCDTSTWCRRNAGGRIFHFLLSPGATLLQYKQRSLFTTYVQSYNLLYNVLKSNGHGDTNCRSNHC